MGTATKIEWADNTASPWYGCSRVHTGCINCYAESLAKRNPSTLGTWGPQGTRVSSESFHRECRKWNRAAEAANCRQSVFPSLCDPFEDWNGPILDSHGTRLEHDEGSHSAVYGNRFITIDDLRSDLFCTIDACPWLDFLLLTKRPENIRRMWPGYDNDYRSGANRMHLGNVQLLYSASDQATYDSGIPSLLACSDLVPVVGLSLEPLVGPITLSPEFLALSNKAWVIVGGESGHHARPMHPDWVRAICDQCVAAGVAFHFKQWGEWLPQDHHPFQPKDYGFLFRDGRFVAHLDDTTTAREICGMGRVGKKAAGRLLDGRTWDEFPQVA